MILAGREKFDGGFIIKGFQSSAQKLCRVIAQQAFGRQVDIKDVLVLVQQQNALLGQIDYPPVLQLVFS